MNQAPTTSHTFQSIEQLDEVLHTMGWSTEYRQLQPGSFSSTFSILDGESWFLLEEHSSRHVECQAPAPAGMYVLALTDSAVGAVNGHLISDGHIFVQGPDSDFRATLEAGLKAIQIGIEAERFENMMLAVAPNLSIPRSETFTIAAPPEQLLNIRQAMRASLFTPAGRNASREEAISSILANLAVVMADQGKNPISRRLHSAATLQAVNRAREYIEAHLDRTIRIASLCRYAGTSFSTLERAFRREMGVLPQQYVKARRLNAVRGRLLSADRDQRLGVTEAALSHGFVHLGRFAGDYQSYFGEYPKQTLEGR